MMGGLLRPLAFGVLLATPLDRLGHAADVEYGAYLAQECASCHQNTVENAGIPKIAGLPKDYFIQALSWYKKGVRDNITMQTIARSLDDEQIAALAAYYEQQ